MKKLLLQITKFIGFSGIGWLIDFGVYNLLNVYSNNIELHNYISSLCGVTFVFFASTRKTFERNTSKIPLLAKYLLYVIYQLLLIFIISKLLLLINNGICGIFANTSVVDYAAVIAKIIVTPITMIVNFLVMKFLIERI